MEQILPETSFRYGFLQILVCGSQKTDVKTAFFHGADRLVTFFLQGTKQEHLRLVGEVAYLVKKKCSAISLLKQACLVTDCTGKRTFPVTEEFRRGKFFGYGSAINRYIRPVLSTALFMQFPRYVFLACTGSSAQKDGYVGSRNQAYLAVHLTGLVTFNRTH